MSRRPSQRCGPSRRRVRADARAGSAAGAGAAASDSGTHRQVREGRGRRGEAGRRSTPGRSSRIGAGGRRPPAKTRDTIQRMAGGRIYAEKPKASTPAGGAPAPLRSALGPERGWSARERSDASIGGWGVPERRWATSVEPWRSVGDRQRLDMWRPDGNTRPLPLQAKLAVGAVDDPLEKEADHVADRVMRMPEPASGTELRYRPRRAKRYSASVPRASARRKRHSIERRCPLPLLLRWRLPSSTMCCARPASDSMSRRARSWSLALGTTFARSACTQVDRPPIRRAR